MNQNVRIYVLKSLIEHNTRIMTLVERIQDLFQKFNTNLEVSEKVELETQAVLDNGTVIYTDAESFDAGVDVYIINEEGEKIPLPQGDYTMEDGRVLSVGEGGKVTQAPVPAEAVGESPKAGTAPSSERSGGGGSSPSKGGKGKTKKSAQEKLAEVQLEEEEKEEEVVAEEEEKEELTEEKIIEIVNKVIDERMGDKEKEMEEEEEKEEEMGVGYDPDKNYSAQIAELKEELSALKNEAAATGVKRAVPKVAAPEPVDMTNLSTEERISALFNQFNQ